MIDAVTRRLVRERAGNRCKYCGMPQAQQSFPFFHVDHIIAQQHGGTDKPSNLALSCYHCNLHKGSNLTGIDPETGVVVVLFHPRAATRGGYSTETGRKVKGCQSGVIEQE